jgi:putative membrane protein
VKLIKLVFFLFFLLVGASFAVLNSDSVMLDYYFSTLELPLSIILIVFMSLGAVLGVFACSGLMLRLKHENSSLKRKASLVHEEVKNLRTIPIRDK